MVPLTIAVELLQDHPQLLIAVAIVARLARAWQSSLTWPEYRAIHRLKRGVFPLLDRLPYVGTWILWVSEKRGRDDPEYLATITKAHRTVATALRTAGGNPHVLNSVKRRPNEHGDRYTIAHLVWTHDDDTQTEAYLFVNDDGTTDVYVHHEPSTDHPLAHLTESQSNGDVRGVVTDALEAAYGKGAV